MIDVKSRLESLNPETVPPMEELKLPGKVRRNRIYLVASIFTICLSVVGLTNLRTDYMESQIVLTDNTYLSPNELWNSKTIVTLEMRKK